MRICVRLRRGGIAPLSRRPAIAQESNILIYYPIYSYIYVYIIHVINRRRAPWDVPSSWRRFRDPKPISGPPGTTGGPRSSLSDICWFSLEGKGRRT